MAEVKAGRACVYGIDGTIAYTGRALVTGGATAALASPQTDMQSVSLTHDFDTTELPDQSGETIGKAARNSRTTIAIDLFILAPTGTNTDAEAKAAIKLPDPLAIVALASFGNTSFDGDWNYAGPGSVNLAADGYARVSLTLTRNNGAALAIIT